MFLNEPLASRCSLGNTSHIGGRGPIRPSTSVAPGQLFLLEIDAYNTMEVSRLSVKIFRIDFP